uniref:extracellular catalytic domain type 1 short-chain-length polyhydroxyalkanoate depolymerase n=1 Tax=Acrocarpospora catenulata TaxID=2836182 RepID=UPI002023A639
MAKLIGPFRMALTAVLVLAGLVLARPASAASLVEVTNFGTNPTNLRMHIYVPDNVQPNPPILVAVHYCTGSGQAFYSGTQFASLADQYGFIVIYPTATRSGSCFDVSSPQALTHNGGSDPVGIVSMVRWAVQNRGGDANRVYVTGASSGGMMTNVLIGAYPDVFKAGAAFMGVPFACFATTDGSSWNSQCSSGQRIMTPQQWGDLVRNAFPGYSGARPPMQIWHGTTDTTLAYPNFNEQIKQWTNVHGLSQTPTSTDTPQSGWTRTRYRDSGGNLKVEAISIANTGHSLPLSGQAAMAIQFFGLNTTPSTDTTPPTTPGTPTASNITSSGATLTWTASTDTGGSGLAGYNIYRRQGTTDTLIAQSTTNSVNLTGLTASTQYQVLVRARDGAGNLSGNSAVATFTTTGGGTTDTTPPTTPGTPTASNITSSGATLTWTASTDTGGSGLAGYNVYRRVGTTDTLLGSPTTNSITLTGLTASTQYQVFVQARDGEGNLSSNSALATFTTTGGGTGGGCSATATTQTQWSEGYVIEPV